jgi:hypothetical protein
MNLLVKDSHGLTVITGLSLANSWIYQAVGVTLPDPIVPH